METTTTDPLDDRRRALAEACAASVLDHPHIAAVADLADDGRRLTLSTTPVSSATARDWLTARRLVSAGEAVTLLVPVLRALLHVERRGLDRRIDLTSCFDLAHVRFDARGAPIVVGVRARERVSGSCGSARIAQRLVGEVVASAVGGSVQARATLDELVAAADPPSVDVWIEALFEWDVPAALEEAPAVAEAGEEAASRARGPADRDEGGDDLRRVVADGDALGGPLRVRLHRVLASPRAMRVGAELRAVRPRVWLTAGIVAASIVVATVLLPGNGGVEHESTAAGSPAASAPPPAATGAPGTASPPGTDPAGSAPSNPATTTRPTPTTEPDTTSIARAERADAAAISGGEALPAVGALLRRRAACLRALDAECLAGVDESGSPALTDDVAAVDDPTRRLARLPVAPVVTGVGESLGGAVLFAGVERIAGSNDEPAVVLVVRTTAGWRLRDVRRSGDRGP